MTEKVEVRVWFCTSCERIFDVDHPDVKFLRPPDANHALIEHERRAHNLIFTTNKAIRDRMELVNRSRPVSAQNRVAIAKELDAKEADTKEVAGDLAEVFLDEMLGELDAKP
jgi:hypothetical protein